MIEESLLDLSLLEIALTQFQSVLEDYELHPQTRAYRDSVVIHFVTVYNLSLPRAVRRALDLGVLKCEWEQFVKYSKARNSVAHVYDLAKAESLVPLAPARHEDARFLLESVKRRIHEP